MEGWVEVGKRLEGWLTIQEHYFRGPEFLVPREIQPQGIQCPLLASKGTVCTQYVDGHSGETPICIKI